ncbi:MAG TPA: phospho-sugar mutase [Spirochaetota bacterium]|nr:phospho-sugar mutase [Spirochaetota bacterium]
MEDYIKNKVDYWLNNDFDEPTKEAVKAMNEEELIEAFYTDLKFGTGGLRGIMGAGTNRINKYIIAKATQGFADYLHTAFPGEQLSVAVAHDSRNNSRFFAEITAAVFSANKIKVFLFKELRPTPELSFALRHFQANAGVVITASHNPKEYNGYKAYWQDGGQVLPPHDKGIIDAIAKIDNITAIDTKGNPALIETITEEIDKIYINKICSLKLSPAAIKNNRDLKIVYTPIHGSGITVVPRALEQYGFTNITLVDEQKDPDGNFPTVPYPNPEERAAMEPALKKAGAVGADIILATDPDTDRVGMGIKKPDQSYTLLNGNQTGSILIYYLLHGWQAAGKLTGSEYIVKTIVTSELFREIAAAFQVECMEVLTGFKYIAEKIRLNEKNKTFIAGGEESYGYLTGSFVRDKDAVIACCLLSECAAWAAAQGKSLYDILMEIYIKYGFFLEQLVSVKKKGKQGLEEIKKMMHTFHTAPPTEINNTKILYIKDYARQLATDTVTGRTAPLDQPVSEVVQFFLEDKTIITARPSGTEPKIKFYFAVKGTLNQSADFPRVYRELTDKITAYKKITGDNDAS